MDFVVSLSSILISNFKAQKTLCYWCRYSCDMWTAVIRQRFAVNSCTKPRNSTKTFKESGWRLAFKKQTSGQDCTVLSEFGELDTNTFSLNSVYCRLLRLCQHSKPNPLRLCLVLKQTSIFPRNDSFKTFNLQWKIGLISLEQRQVPLVMQCVAFCFYTGYFWLWLRFFSSV